jgi:hypothetical protein
MISLDAARKAVDAVHEEIHPLVNAQNEAIAALSISLRSPLDRAKALLLLNCLPQYMSRPLIPELIECAEDERLVELARSTLGRMSSPSARTVVFSEVMRRLNSPGADGRAFQRMAELLDFLGYDGELRQVTDLARGIGDQRIRETTDDYS